jgi:acyl carrier protein
MSPESAVATQIRTALAKHLKRDVSKIRGEDDLREDLGIDSLAMIELLFQIEEVFNLEIPNEDLSKITTVGDVIAYVEARVDGGGASPGAAAKSAKPVAKKKGSPRA